MTKTSIAVARHNLISVIAAVIHALKRRDRREPGWQEKEAAEARLAAAMSRAFGKQARKVREYLGTVEQVPAAKYDPVATYIDLASFDDEDVTAITARLIEAAQGGVYLFGQAAGLEINYTLVNKEAARWIRNYIFRFLKDLSTTTIDSLKYNIARFIETPGMTIGEVMQFLPFDEQRAKTIAVTEITRAYAQGNQLAGEELKREFPGVKVVKVWFTNNDDLVCDICAPLNGVEVEIDASWEGGIDNPPAHVNCRCWTDSSTSILG